MNEKTPVNSAIIEILLKTDAAHPLTVKEISRLLSAKGFDCKPGVIADSIALLDDTEVIRTRKGFSSAYYALPADRNESPFTPAELRMLADCVMASKFLPQKSSDELIKKLSRIARDGGILNRNIVNYAGKSDRFSEVYSSVNIIAEAISRRMSITFSYFDLDENLEKHFRKNGATYSSDPLYIILADDNYYLLSYSKKYGDLCTYRIDRMHRPSVSSDPMSNEAVSIIEKLDINSYLRESFGMYGGESAFITLEAENSKINAIIDKFGEKLHMTRIDESRVSVRVHVQISPKFYGWLVMQEGLIRIASPERIKSGYIEYLRKLISL